MGCVLLFRRKILRLYGRYGNEKIGRKECPSALYRIIRVDYLFTLNFSLPLLMKSTICLAAAIPALVLASVVCAPIFLGVEK